MRGALRRLTRSDKTGLFYPFTGRRVQVVGTTTGYIRLPLAAKIGRRAFFAFFVDLFFRDEFLNR